MFNHWEIVTLTYIYFKGYDTKNQEQHEQLLNYSHKLKNSKNDGMCTHMVLGTV